MIDDLDRTIRELLNQELPRVQAGQVDVAFFPPNRDWRREGSALNFFLYDVRENAALRQHQWQEVRTGEPGARAADHQVQLRRTPLRLDCFYMVTAWSTDPIDEHRLLTECLIALARYPVLNQQDLDERKLHAERRSQGQPPLADEAARRAAVTAMRTVEGRTPLTNGNRRSRSAFDFLVGALRSQDLEIRTRVAFHDVMTNPAEIWSSLENTMKAALSYVVTLPINPWLEQDQMTTAVGAATFNIPVDQRYAGKPGVEQTRPATPDQRPTYVGGVVKMARFPADGLELWLVEKGLSTRIDEQGRFVFRRAPVGSYTLEVRTVKEQTVLARRAITVPVKNSGPGHLIVFDLDASSPPPPTAGPEPAPADEPAGATAAAPASVELPPTVGPEPAPAAEPAGATDAAATVPLAVDPPPTVGTAPAAESPTPPTEGDETATTNKRRGRGKKTT